MARKSRKLLVGIEQSSIAEKTTAKCFRAGIYARLSYVRHGKEKESEGTIENQIDLLKPYLVQQDDIVLKKEYTDLDCAGTDFDRPGFEEMMTDVKNGIIDCIIVKDLSRLGRNYIEIGTYIERVFPFFGVRFISITDQFDSLRDEVDLSIPLKNIVNEYYAKDISRKILTSLESKFRRGECAVSRLPYGYMKDPVDKHRMIIDAAVVENVRFMFEMAYKGTKISEIKNYLNDQGILSPAAYKDMVRLGYVREETNKFWSETGIKKILCNYNYTGNTAHGVKSGSKYCDQRYKEVPKSEWLIVKNTHEAIISLDMYERIQVILESHKKKYAEDTKNGEKFNRTINMAIKLSVVIVKREQFIMEKFIDREHTS